MFVINISIIFIAVFITNNHLVGRLEEAMKMLPNSHTLVFSLINLVNVFYCLETMIVVSKPYSESVH